MTGWDVFGGLIAWASETGNILDPAVIAGIATINVTYQQDEYLPRQTEAVAIYDWFHTTQDATDRESWDAECAVRSGRLSELDLEIDLAWNAACNAAYDLVGQTIYEAYLAALGDLP